ncbi:MAG: hypothetical protein JXA94_04940 [Parachlamydiales bacterium]|nr:hypothetical protein [Parachlamydiales bacterium]
MSATFFQPLLDSIFSSRLPALSYDDENYDDSLRTTVDKICDTLATLINQLNAGEWFTPIASATSLAQLGKKINHVHVLNILETFFNEKNRKNIETIFDRNVVGVSICYIKNSFIEKTVKGLEDTHKMNQILPYLESFANRVGKDKEALDQLAKQNRFEDFFNFLIEPPPTSFVTTAAAEYREELVLA